MKKFKHILSILILLLGALMAQVKPQLAPSDIDKLLKIMPEMDEFIQKNQIEFDEKGDIDNMVKEIQFNARLKAFFPKYGMSAESFAKKLGVMLKAYAFLKYQEYEKITQPKMQKSMEDLKNNPYLSDEQKKSYLKQLEDAQKQMSSTYKKWKEEIHPLDLELVRKNLQKIELVMEKMEKVKPEKKEK